MRVSLILAVHRNARMLQRRGVRECQFLYNSVGLFRVKTFSTLWSVYYRGNIFYATLQPPPAEKMHNIFWAQQDSHILPWEY